jgi:hypothetical protein
MDSRSFEAGPSPGWQGGNAHQTADGTLFGSVCKLVRDAASPSAATAASPPLKGTVKLRAVAAGVRVAGRCWNGLLFGL